MPEINQRCLILAASAASGLADASEFLAAQGWDVLPADSVRAAERHARAGNANTGVLDLSGGYTEQDIAGYTALLSDPRTGWVVAVAPTQLDDPRIRRLIRDYCFDYFTLPCASDRIATVVGHACGMAALQSHSESRPDAPDRSTVDRCGMVGGSAPMRYLFRSLRKLADSDAPVFVFGETGTGKELTALAIHQQSARSGKPFVAINCGAIPSHLVQSELFGYERGAFTGANQRKIGRIEAAHGGTLFLDEIGDLPLESQVNLLRFLQQGAVERLGGHDAIAVDVRVISATHVDLEAAVTDGRFRSDLYHRLCVLRIDQPPLRERGADIALLAQHALAMFSKESRRRLKGFTPCAIEAIYRYPWPGNVRELINRVRRAVVMAEGRMITGEDLNLSTAESTPAPTLDDARSAAERQAIEHALLRNNGRLGDSARELGISRVTLYRLMCRHGMRADDLVIADDARQGA